MQLDKGNFCGVSGITANECIKKYIIIPQVSPQVLQKLVYTRKTKEKLKVGGEKSNFHRGDKIYLLK